MLMRLVTLCCLLLGAEAAFGAAADDGRPAGYPTIATIMKGNGCVPKDNMARVLKSAHPYDNAPNWTGKNSIGIGYTLLPNRYVVTDAVGGIFLQGDLLTPRGTVMQRGVFVLYDEWNCAGLSPGPSLGHSP
jgi:hypothetical protein